VNRFERRKPHNKGLNPTRLSPLESVVQHALRLVSWRG
jgi:hypothetical protein